MTTIDATTFVKTITPETDRSGRRPRTEYRAELDGQFVGYYKTNHDAEVACDQLIRELIASGACATVEALDGDDETDVNWNSAPARYVRVPANARPLPGDDPTWHDTQLDTYRAFPVGYDPNGKIGGSELEHTLGERYIIKLNLPISSPSFVVCDPASTLGAWLTSERGGAKTWPTAEDAERWRAEHRLDATIEPLSEPAPTEHGSDCETARTVKLGYCEDCWCELVRLEAVTADVPDYPDELAITIRQVIARLRETLPAIAPTDPTVAALDATVAPRVRDNPDAQLVRQLARQHLPSAFSGLSYDLALLDQLADRDEPIPDELGMPVLRAWGAALGIVAPDAFWRAFRDAAIMLTVPPFTQLIALAVAGPDSTPAPAPAPGPHGPEDTTNNGGWRSPQLSVSIGS